MSQILNLFPIPVLKGHIDPPEGLFEAIAEKLEDCHKGKWAAETGKSTGELGMNLHQDVPEVSLLIDLMMDTVVEYWDNHLKYAPAQIEPMASWSNWHTYNDFTGEHSHSNGRLGCHIASVYYLQKDEGGDICLCDPLDYLRRLTPLHKDNGDAIISEPVPTRTGDFLLFPGWVRHRTNRATNKRQAISINFNGNLV